MHKPVSYTVFVTSILSKLSIHTIHTYVGAMQLYLHIANGNPSFCNEHTPCMHVLKISNIPEVAVEFKHYRTKIYICM